MNKKAFDGFNATLAASNLPPLANPRNAAAGSLRQLDAGITAARPLRLPAVPGVAHADNVVALVDAISAVVQAPVRKG